MGHKEIMEKRLAAKREKKRFWRGARLQFWFWLFIACNILLIVYHNEVADFARKVVGSFSISVDYSR
ncbi:hypothetical protein COB72_00815 [bacterium]|nr:MAG: hypothetical protein COB72_00815 [bacterium]